MSKRKNKKLGKMLFQIIPPVFISMIIIGIISLILTFISTSGAYLDVIGENCHNMTDYMVRALEGTDNIEWLFDYWEENYETMNVDWNNLTGLTPKKNEFTIRNPDVNIDNISLDEIKKLDEKSKRLYAEINYIVLNKKLDRLKQTYKPAYLYIITIQEDGKEFFFMSGRSEGEYRGNEEDADIFTLGKTQELDYTVYHTMKKTFDTGTTCDDYESSNLVTEEARKGVHYYTPLLVDGKTRVMAGVSIDTSILAEKIIKIFNMVAGFALIMYLIMVVVMIFLISRIVINPLVKVQKGVKNFGDDLDLDKLNLNLSKVKSKNEIKDLANEVDAMGNLLVAHINEIEVMTKKQEKINSELALANSIQEGALPDDFDNLPKEWGVEIYGTMHPAKEVGGDLYDYVVIDDDHLAILIGDVSGKGVPAALFMMITKVIIENECKYTQSPAEILRLSNERLCDNNSAEMFVTAWLGIYEISTGILRCANAGHEYPVIKKGNGPFELYKDKHGMVLAGMSGVKYTNYEIQIEPGDVIVVYSDGVPEAIDVNERMFGADTIPNELNCCEDGEPKQYVDYLLNSLNQYTKGADQFDDITVVAVKFNKPLAKEDKE